MPTQKNKADYRGIPTPTCPNCGSNWFRMTVMFDEIGYMPSAFGMVQTTKNIKTYQMLELI